MIATDVKLDTARTQTIRKRSPVAITCPSCGERGESAASTVRCGACGLRAPRTAFSGAVAARTFGAPRAFTIRGNID